MLADVALPAACRPLCALCTCSHHWGFIVRKSHSADLSLRPKPASLLFFCIWLSVVEDEEAAPGEDMGLMGVLGCACTARGSLQNMCIGRGHHFKAAAAFNFSHERRM